MRNGAYRTGFKTLSTVTNAFLPIIFTTARRPSEGGNGESPCFIRVKQGDIFDETWTTETVPANIYYILSLE